MNRKFKGFTIAEMLITMALTSVVVTFSYFGLNHVQQLFQEYRNQTDFITELNTLQGHLDLLSKGTRKVVSEGNSKFIFTSPSFTASLELNSSNITIEKQGDIYMFHSTPKNISVEYENMASKVWADQLIKKIDFDIHYQNERFHMEYIAHYDSFSKLLLEEEALNGN